MLREEHKMTKKQLAEILHVAPSLVSEWERGTRTVRTEHLVNLADYFDVSVDWLMGRDAPRSLSPHLPPGAWPLGSVVKVPVLGVIRAGEPLITEQNIVAWEEVPMDMVRDADYFFLQVSGDSMIGARIAEGDRVLVRQQAVVGDGEMAVVMVSGEEATLKRVHRRNGQVILASENPDYPPMLVPEGEAVILGRVVKVWFDPK
jgi:repressor LexA